MRIRTFTGRTAKEAITLVRATLGEDAVIVAIDEAANGRGVIVRAAGEDVAPPPASANPPTSPEERLEALLRCALGQIGGVNLRAA